MSDYRNRKVQNKQLARYSDPFESMRALQEKMSSQFGFGRHFASDFFADDFDPFSRQLSSPFGFGDMMMGCGESKAPQGNYVCHSYVSSTTIGPDGRPITQKKVRNETGKLGRDGQQIRETNEVYNHSGDNLQRVTRERGLGDKHLVVTREIKNQERHERRNLINIEEDEVDAFQRQWSDVAHRERLPQTRYSNPLEVPSRGQLRLKMDRHN